MKQLEKAYKY